MKRIVLILLVAYVGAYLAYRNANTQVDPETEREVTVYPKEFEILYVLFRPLAKLDAEMSQRQSRLLTDAEGS